ncbi:MAG: hypothetical protein AB1776_03185 [Bacillota bacterium]
MSGRGVMRGDDRHNCNRWPAWKSAQPGGVVFALAAFFLLFAFAWTPPARANDVDALARDVATALLVEGLHPEGAGGGKEIARDKALQTGQELGNGLGQVLNGVVSLVDGLANGLLATVDSLANGLGTALGSLSSKDGTASQVGGAAELFAQDVADALRATVVSSISLPGEPAEKNVSAGGGAQETKAGSVISQASRSGQGSAPHHEDRQPLLDDPTGILLAGLNVAARSVAATAGGMGSTVNSGSGNGADQAGVLDTLLTPVHLPLNGVVTETHDPLRLPPFISVFSPPG